MKSNQASSVFQMISIKPAKITTTNLNMIRELPAFKFTNKALLQNILSKYRTVRMQNSWINWDSALKWLIYGQPHVSHLISIGQLRHQAPTLFIYMHSLTHAHHSLMHTHTMTLSTRRQKHLNDIEDLFMTLEQQFDYLDERSEAPNHNHQCKL